MISTKDYVAKIALDSDNIPHAEAYTVYGMQEGGGRSYMPPSRQLIHSLAIIIITFVLYEIKTELKKIMKMLLFINKN